MMLQMQHVGHIYMILHAIGVVETVHCSCRHTYIPNMESLGNGASTFVWTII